MKYLQVFVLFIFTNINISASDSNVTYLDIVEIPLIKKLGAIIFKNGLNFSMSETYKDLKSSFNDIVAQIGENENNTLSRNELISLLSVPRSANDEGTVPKIINGLIKYAYNYLVEPYTKSDAATGKEGEHDSNLTSTFCLIAFITFASFILFVLHPLLTFPKKQRIHHGHYHHRRHAPRSKYAYRGRGHNRGFRPYPVSHSTSSYSSSESKHIRSPPLIHNYHYSSNSPPIHKNPKEHIDQVVYRSTSKPIYNNEAVTGTPSLKSIYDESSIDETNKYYKSSNLGTSGKFSKTQLTKEERIPNSEYTEEKLTKEEIMYILKTLDDE